MMFINLVDPDAIPAEVEASPPAFRRELEEFVRSLGVGGPGWDERLLIGGIYYWGDLSPDEVEDRYRGIARKNRVTAEALLLYFQRFGVSGPMVEPL
jgi:hypothetical protein